MKQMFGSDRIRSDSFISRLRCDAVDDAVEKPADGASDHTSVPQPSTFHYDTRHRILQSAASNHKIVTKRRLNM